MALDARPGDGSCDLATSWDDGDFDAFSCEGEIQRFLIVSYGNLAGDDFVYLDLSALSDIVCCRNKRSQAC